MHVVPAPDGVPVAYQVRGQGSTALVFVHCWACDRSFWHNQADRFSKSYRVVTLDLPGHGESGAGRNRWTIEGLAADVEAVVNALDLSRVILVGHSMGGPVSLVAARRMPKRVIGIACVDTLHDAEFEWDPGMAEKLADRLEANFEDGMENLVPQMFPEGADPDIVKNVVSKATSADKRAVLALMRYFPDFNLGAAFSNAKVPIRCVNSRPLPPMIPETAVATNRRYADFDALLLDGVGHYPMLEKPEEFNRLLETVLRDLSGT